MKIIRTPAPYASAYRVAPVRISATEDELVELDIYDGTKSTVMGRRRFTGATSYDANIANYARNMLDVAPLYGVQSTFAHPLNRSADLIVAAGETEAAIRLGAGIRTLFAWEKLSASPDMRRIAPGESDEIALLPDGHPLQATVTLRGSGERTLQIATQSGTEELTSFYLKTNDLAERFGLTGNELVGRYDTMDLRIDSGDEEIFTQRYRLSARSPEGVRLCWWNTFGQIDYYTMQTTEAEGYETQKERTRTAAGYRTTGSRRERRMALVSDFETKETMEWLAEIASSPRVWIVGGTAPARADVLSSSVITHGLKLCRMALEIRLCETENFQHE